MEFLMSLNQCIIEISEKLNINTLLASKVYKTFWTFVEDNISEENITFINGIGYFYLEKNFSPEKAAYSLKFRPDINLTKKINEKI